MSFAAFAQDEEARLINEFSSENSNSENLELGLKEFMYELQINPEKKGYIVIYSGEKQLLGSPIRYSTMIESFFSHYKLPRNRFEFINAGRDLKFRTQLWIHPSSSKNPNRCMSDVRFLI